MDKNLIFYDIVYSVGGTEHICTASECEHSNLKQILKMMCFQFI